MSFLRSATPQWLLMHVLGDFCATSLSLEATFDVTMSLVGLLEAIDEWELAMFVGSRLRLDGRNSTETLTTAAWSEHYAAEWLVKELLHRHVVDLSASPDSLGFLTEYVNVPLEWIADAQGHAAMNNDCNYALAADHFAKAANFVEVWDVSRDLPYLSCSHSASSAASRVVQALDTFAIVCAHRSQCTVSFCRLHASVHRCLSMSLFLSTGANYRVVTAA
jgi:hypothetical protein